MQRRAALGGEREQLLRHVIGFAERGGPDVGRQGPGRRLQRRGQDQPGRARIARGCWNDGVAAEAVAALRRLPFGGLVELGRHLVRAMAHPRREAFIADAQLCRAKGDAASGRQQARMGDGALLVLAHLFKVEQRPFEDQPVARPRQDDIEQPPRRLFRFGHQPGEETVLRFGRCEGGAEADISLVQHGVKVLEAGITRWQA